jgi:hypothetical protein
MGEFQAYSPDDKVAGEVVEGFLGGFPPNLREAGTKILEKHRIVDPKVGDWYPLQSLLDAMKEISESFGSEMLFRIGSQMSKTAKVPDHIQTLEELLSGLDKTYLMNHQGGSMGGWEYSYDGVQGSLHRAKLVSTCHYPCAFDRGVIDGFAKRFKPAGCTDVIVRGDESQPCRRNGGTTCTYLISWD